MSDLGVAKKLATTPALVSGARELPLTTDRTEIFSGFLRDFALAGKCVISVVKYFGKPTQLAILELSG